MRIIQRVKYELKQENRQSQPHMTFKNPWLRIISADI